ncbi:unnamed protein product [Rotaria sordida]|uniref:Uncharacterized protein n=4 Tax=Rotaria sordida TaxID=392033 RepID=A0A814ZVD8_9BILA|nr:unnamed protein product [Rotaria sordida]
MDIEKHSTMMNSLLTLGHNLLNETDIYPRTIDSISRTVQTLEQRWLSLKELIMKRKFESDNIHISWRNIDETINRISKMINDHERFLTEIKRTSGDGLQGIRNEYKSLENFKRTLDNDDKEIQKIANCHSEILRLYPTADSNNEIRNRIKDLNHRWKILNETVHETLKHLKYMLSIHGDFQLTQDSLLLWLTDLDVLLTNLEHLSEAPTNEKIRQLDHTQSMSQMKDNSYEYSLLLWLTDLDVLLTNLEHLSEAPTNEKIRQLDSMDREIQDKQAKIEYVQKCANYLLNKTVDARGLTINMNELAKFLQQLKNLTKRIRKLKQNLMNPSDRHLDLMSSVRISTSPTRKRLASPSPPRSRSPNRYYRNRDRFLCSYDKIELDDCRQRADKLLADFEDILLQINADFRSKEEIFHSSIPMGVQIENLSMDFTYNRILTSTRRKIDALREFILQIKQELGAYLIQDLNNDPMVLDIMNKWTYLQTLANDKDGQLNQSRQRWKYFKRQLEDLEQLAQEFANSDHLSSRTIYSTSDVNQRLDEFEILLKSTIDLANEFNDNSNEWIIIEHRLQLIKDKFQYLLTKSNRQYRELKTNYDIKHEILEINSQLDHLEILTHSLEPIDNNEINQNINRTKLHRFIRIHDDIEIINERLIKINDYPSSILSNDQIRQTNDLKLLFDRLNSIKRIVRIYLDQLEKLLAQNEINQNFSQLRTLK